MKHPAINTITLIYKLHRGDFRKIITSIEEKLTNYYQNVIKVIQKLK